MTCPVVPPIFLSFWRSTLQSDLLPFSKPGRSGQRGRRHQALTQCLRGVLSSILRLLNDTASVLPSSEQEEGQRSVWHREACPWIYVQADRGAGNDFVLTILFKNEQDEAEDGGDWSALLRGRPPVQHSASNDSQTVPHPTPSC